jgi:DNA-binding protein HU-beta
MQWRDNEMAAVKKVDTVTLKDLAASLAETHSLPKAQANIMLTEMVANVGKHLKKGSRIRIPGLGILQSASAPHGWVATRRTGETIKIKASKKIAFRASKDLKEAVMET